MLRLIKENINGILGTVIFHLFLMVIVMAARLTSVDISDEISLLIEFAPDITEEEFRAYTESLMAQDGVIQDESNLQTARNIAVNVSEERPVADQFREMSQEQMSELDQRVDQILNNAANGEMPVPEQPEIEFEPPADIINLEEDEDYEPYAGPTTITYDLQGRKHLRIPVPVYKCPDGGVVNVNISVNRQGRVVRAMIENSPSGFNEICIHETAIEASLASHFNEDPDAPPVQAGIITFYFQKQ